MLNGSVHQFKDDEWRYEQEEKPKYRLNAFMVKNFSAETQQRYF